MNNSFMAILPWRLLSIGFIEFSELDSLSYSLILFLKFKSLLFFELIILNYFLTGALLKVFM